jgi:hypothetical protein
LLDLPKVFIDFPLRAPAIPFSRLLPKQSMTGVSASLDNEDEMPSTIHRVDCGLPKNLPKLRTSYPETDGEVDSLLLKENLSIESGKLFATCANFYTIQSNPLNVTPGQGARGYLGAYEQVILGGELQTHEAACSTLDRMCPRLSNLGLERDRA